MINVNGKVINEEKMLYAKTTKLRNGSYEIKHWCNISFGNKEEVEFSDITAEQVFAAIEAKNNLPKQQAAEIEALKKELKDTEDLYLKGIKEIEYLLLQVKKLSVNIATAPDCEFALIGQSGLCVGNVKCLGDCSKCEIYCRFCEPAVDDENGCNGIKDPSGATHPKCLTCPGWMMHFTPSGDPERD